MMTIGAFFGVAYKGYLVYRREDVNTAIQKVANGIERYAYSYGRPDEFIHRNDAKKELYKSTHPQSKPDCMQTFVVYGPRGSGKSTAVEIAKDTMMNRPILVAPIQRSIADEDNLACAIINAAVKQ